MLKPALDIQETDKQYKISLEVPGVEEKDIQITLDILGRFTEELFVLQRAIRMGDGALLHDYFTRTRAIRRGIIEAGQDTSAPDFGRAPAAAKPDGRA